MTNNNQIWKDNPAKRSSSLGVTRAGYRSSSLVAPLTRPRGALSFVPNHPLPKVPQRSPSKSNKRETLADIAERIPLRIMWNFFDFPLRTAAEAMRISVTTLKRLCRRHGVKRWPHRQISGINRALSDLEEQLHLAKGEAAQAVAYQLRKLKERRDVIIELAFENDGDSPRRATYSSETSSLSEAIAHTHNIAPPSSADYSLSSASSLTTGSVTAPSSPDALVDFLGCDSSFDEQPPAPVYRQTTSAGQDNLVSGHAARFTPDDGGGGGGGGDCHRQNSSVLLVRPPSSLSPPSSPIGSKIAPAQKRSTIFGNALGAENSARVRLQGRQEPNRISTRPHGSAGSDERSRSVGGYIRSFANPCPAFEMDSGLDPQQVSLDESHAWTGRVMTSRMLSTQPRDSILPSESATGNFVRNAGRERVRTPFSQSYNGLSAGSCDDMLATDVFAGSTAVRTGQQQEMRQLSTLDDLLLTPEKVATLSHNTWGKDRILTAIGSVDRGGMRSHNMRSQGVNYEHSGWTSRSHHEPQNSLDMWSNDDQALVGTPSAVPGSQAWIQEVVTTDDAGSCVSSAWGGGGGAGRQVAWAGFTCPQRSVNVQSV